MYHSFSIPMLSKLFVFIRNFLFTMIFFFMLKNYCEIFSCNFEIYKHTPDLYKCMTIELILTVFILL